MLPIVRVCTFISEIRKPDNSKRVVSAPLMMDKPIKWQKLGSSQSSLKVTMLLSVCARFSPSLVRQVPVDGALTRCTVDGNKELFPKFFEENNSKIYQTILDAVEYQKLKCWVP